MKLLIVQLLPFFCYFIPLWCKYLFSDITDCVYQAVVFSTLAACCRHLLHPLVWILNLPIVAALRLAAPREGKVSLLLAAACVSRQQSPALCCPGSQSCSLCGKLLFASNSEYLFKYCSVINKNRSNSSYASECMNQSLVSYSPYTGLFKKDGAKVKLIYS
jgi:hypothetical protein